MLIEAVIFYIFSALLLGSALMVICSDNPVRGALFLVLAFFATSALWILLQAEFLGLILIVVYVGAVMTLFLFVVMMLDIDIVPMKEGFVRYLPLGVLISALLIATMIGYIAPSYYKMTGAGFDHSASFSNITEIGNVLYTEYMLPFELAGVLLLVAMIAAISLAFRGRRKDSKAQRVGDQVAVEKHDRLRIIKMKSEKKQ